VTNDASRRALTEKLAALGLLAAGQHGVFTRAQAFGLGFTAGSVERRVTRGSWIAVDHGVYRAAESPTSWRQALMAPCLFGPAVASHRSAAALWSFPGFDEGIVEVTALRHRRRKARDVLWHETVRFDDREATSLDGIPVTNATRTLLDLGAVVGEVPLLVALDDAVRRGLTSIERMADELDRFGDRRRGSGTVRRVLARRRGGTPTPESPLETLFDQLIQDYGLPEPVRQWPVVDDTGRVVARVDFAYPAAKLVIEIDGARYHAAAGRWEADLARQNAIGRRDLRILRYTSEALTQRPAAVAREIREALRVGPASLAAE
jgi:Protein of unknown function (DUF559)